MDTTQILVMILGALWFVTCGLFALVWRNLEGKLSEMKESICSKVDKDIYDAVQESLIRDIRELKRGQDLIATSLNDIKLSLAESRGAQKEREKHQGEE